MTVDNREQCNRSPNRSYRAVPLLTRGFSKIMLPMAFPWNGADSSKGLVFLTMRREWLSTGRARSCPGFSTLSTDSAGIFDEALGMAVQARQETRHGRGGARIDTRIDASL
jgi:hypothetical protein